MSLFRWVIGEGSISFWTNNWCGEILEGPLPCDQALTVAQAVEIAEDMSLLFPAKYQETLQAIRIVPHKDQLMFTPSESGQFVVKTYLELSRTCGATRMWPRWIWQPFLPPKISTFLWKLLHRAVPTDDRICSRGIPIVSRCIFFSEYNAESIHHLFIQSELAISIWKCFGEIFRMPYVYLSIPNAIALWMNRHTRFPGLICVKRRLLLMFLKKFGTLGVERFFKGKRWMREGLQCEF